MNIKYQIFVSSTYVDLKDERELAMKAILEMGHIPVGMEMFSAGDEEQWQLIQRQIEDCDYYVVIAAHCYGSWDGAISYTEKEYDYACSKGIPVLGFVISEQAQWDIGKSDKDTNKKPCLENFKSKIKTKIINYWKNKEDLYGKVAISLMKQFTTNPRTGWIRANESAGPKVLSEITRLSKENSDLRELVEKNSKEKINEEFEKNKKLIITLIDHTIKFGVFYEDGKSWEDATEYSFYRIFELIAPLVIVERSSEYLNKYIGAMLRPNKSRKIRNWSSIPENVMNDILAELMVFDLVKPSEKKHSIKDENEYWTITDEEKKIFKEIRRLNIEDRLSNNDNPIVSN